MAHVSIMPDIGTRASDFSLLDTNPDTDRDLYTLSDFSDSEALLVAFICNHCPYVVHLRQGLVDFARDYELKRLAVVAIRAARSARTFS